jgi:hypothetical protein
LPELLDQIPEGEEIGTVTAGGAHDTRRATPPSPPAPSPCPTPPRTWRSSRAARPSAATRPSRAL